MRITKELVGVEGEGLQKILNYQRCIETKKRDIMGVHKAFNHITEHLFNKEYEQAVNILESVYMERIPNDFICKISLFTNEEICKMCDKWKVDFVNMGEQGFITLVYSRLGEVMQYDNKDNRQYRRN